MKHMNMSLAILVVFGVLLPVLTASAEGRDASARPIAAPRPTRYVDLAICLDTSNSMDGLIDSAKKKLWAIVNELALARPRPVLRVAIYQYGNDGLDKSNGWVQKVSDLTDDLDAVYGKLFELRTNGGTEYVARVVRAATEQLKWSTEKNALRIIVVAGNEPATQDRKYKLKDVCGDTANKGIIINTIFCGSESAGRNTGWADAARWADGQYAAIDQDGGTVVVKTPYDKKLSELGAKLNSTYVAYGKGGGRHAEAQRLQDTNAAKLGAPAAADRAAAKSTGLYRNAGWDLVDALRENKVDLDKLKSEELPEKMRKMTVAQRKEYIAGQAGKRVEIQKQIKELNAKRAEHVKKEIARLGLSEKDSFDANLRRAIREQAVKKNFRFEDAQ